MPLGKKTVRSINNFENRKPVCKPDTYKTKLREWIDQWEWRWYSRHSRRPQPQLPKGQQEHRWSKIEWIDQPTFIKEIITSLKEKWIHGYQNMTVMSNRIKIVPTNIPQNINSNKTSMMLLAKIYGNSRNQYQLQYLMVTKGIIISGKQHSWHVLIKLQL